MSIEQPGPELMNLQCARHGGHAEPVTPAREHQTPARTGAGQVLCDG